MSTRDAILIEHTRNDSYWGDGGDGTGKNRLGFCLMKVRDLLRQDLDASGLQQPPETASTAAVEPEAKSTDFL